MTLFDHLKNIVEHNDTPVYNGNKVPMYMTNRYLSFISDSHCRIVNTFLNYDHWYEAKPDTQMALYKTVIPKVRFNYYDLFGGYVKQPPIEKDDKPTSDIKLLAKFFDVSLGVAEEYLKQDGVKKFLEGWKEKNQ